MIKNFDSFKQYASFSLGKGFLTHKNEVFSYVKNRGEKLGDLMVSPILKPLDVGIMNIRNPLTIVTLAVIAIAVVTFIFYDIPTIIAHLPIFEYITPEAIRLALFAGSVVVIAGLGIRTLSRLMNETLMTAWTSKEIVPFQIGAEIVRIKA